MDMAGHGALGGVFARADFVLFWAGQREKRVSLLCYKYLTDTAKGSLYLENGRERLTIGSLRSTFV